MEERGIDDFIRLTAMNDEDAISARWSVPRVERVRWLVHRRKIWEGVPEERSPEWASIYWAWKWRRSAQMLQDAYLLSPKTLWQDVNVPRLIAEARLIWKCRVGKSRATSNRVGR